MPIRVSASVLCTARDGLVSYFLVSYFFPPIFSLHGFLPPCIFILLWALQYHYAFCAFYRCKSRTPCFLRGGGCRGISILIRILDLYLCHLVPLWHDLPYLGQQYSAMDQHCPVSPLLVMLCEVYFQCYSSSLYDLVLFITYHYYHTYGTQASF